MKHPEREWFKQLRVLLFAVVSWFALSVAGELIGNQANETEAGQTIGQYVLLVAIVVVPMFLLGWVVLYLRERREPVAEDEKPPPPQLLEPPTWYRREPLCDRRTEVATGTDLVRANGFVAVIGPRDIGTSAVGQAIVQNLIDHHGGDARTTFRFDLRSRSTTEPDDVTATARRVVSPFGIDEPTDETEAVLRRVARQLVDVFVASGGTLMLDNVTTPEQVSWLVREWPTEGRPRLVIAGEMAIGEVVEHGAVEVGQLSLEHLREIWHAELETSGRRLPKRLRGLLDRWRPGEQDDGLDELLRACVGRPRAVKALAQEVRRPGSNVTLDGLLEELHRGGLMEGVLERVSRAILANQRASLSEQGAWLLYALAELPVTGLTKSSIAAMLEVSEEPDALEELRVRNLVEKVDGRYRLPQEIRRAIEGTSRGDEGHVVALTAVPALLRYYTEHAGNWVARLDVDAAGAKAWFKVSEPSFRPLFAHKYSDELLELVLEDLCAIADALERWYVRERQASGLFAVSSGLYSLVERAGRQDLAALAAIRMATAHRMTHRYGEAAAYLDMARTHIDQVRDPNVWPELDIRAQVERALLSMSHGADLDEAFAALDHLRTVTRSPAVLVDLGAVCLLRGALDHALEHLRRAEEVAQDLGDLGAQAHSVELQGVVLSHDDLVEAVRRWQLARATFAKIGEDQGEARCLQHLGAAAAVNARAAGQLAKGHPTALPRKEAAEVALTHLARAKSLRAGQPDTTLVDHYIAVARRVLDDRE